MHVIVERHVALDGDDGSDPRATQAFDRVCHLLGHFTLAEVAKEAPHRRPADVGEHDPKLGREDDQQRDGAIRVDQPQQFRDHRQLQHRRRGIGEENHDNTDQHRHSARPMKQQQDTIDRVAHDRDLENVALVVPRLIDIAGTVVSDDRTRPAFTLGLIGSTAAQPTMASVANGTFSAKLPAGEFRRRSHREAGCTQRADGEDA